VIRLGAVTLAALVTLAPAPRAQVGDTLLHEAVAAGDMELLTYLLDQGVAVDRRAEIDSTTPLHVAAYAGNVGIARILIAHGADVRARAAGGTTPLHMAARGGHAGTVDLLLSEGAAIDATLHGNTTPLSLAAREGHVDVARLLLRRGADIDARGTDLRTPIAEAAERGQLEVVELLLRGGADLTPRDSSPGRGATRRSRNCSSATARPNSYPPRNAGSSARWLYRAAGLRHKV